MEHEADDGKLGSGRLDALNELVEAQLSELSSGLEYRGSEVLYDDADPLSFCPEWGASVRTYECQVALLRASALADPGRYHGTDKYWDVRRVLLSEQIPGSEKQGRSWVVTEIDRLEIILGKGDYTPDDVKMFQTLVVALHDYDTELK